jgi:hypothetical protein
MNTTIHKFTLFLTACLLACATGHAYEQDNWYFHKSFSGLSSANYGPGQIFVELNATDGNDRIYVADCTADKIQVFDFNGTKLFEITGNTKPSGVVVGDNGTIYCLAQSTLKSYNSSGSFIKTFTSSLNTLAYGRICSSDPSGALAINPKNNHLYVLSGNDKKVFIYDQNGTQIKSFGSSGTAPGQLNKPKDLAILPSGDVIVADMSNFNYFDANGTFLFRSANGAIYNLAISQDNIIYASRTGSTTSRILNSDSSSILTSSSLPIVTSNSLTFSQDGDLFFSCKNGTVQIWKRAYRTKGLPQRNVIPQPAIRKISQRSGTNVLDLDFEIVDPDDSNATIGIIVYAGSDKLVPQTWVDGTANKIGTPITTNQVHRVSWDVKQDWTTNTGTIKFEILCQDGRTNKPVDLHFLTLPFSDGNMTISRSPLKDSDFLNYWKFIAATRANGYSLENNSINQEGDNPPSGSIQYVFTNCGTSGREGPTMLNVNTSYLGTNLHGQISMSTQGIQEWTVPETGTYIIEAVGASGGDTSNSIGGIGVYVRSTFTFQQGRTLKILVGQEGPLNNQTNYGAGGGGGTFITETNNTAIMVAGGGGGGANGKVGYSGSESTSGTDGWAKRNDTSVNGGQGGSNGNAGVGLHSSKAGSGISGNAGNGSTSFINGGLGSNISRNGGFGGGGGSTYSDGGGGGGGYSGGGGGGGSGTGGGGGGGSFSSDTNSTFITGFNSGHGKVIISKVQNLGNFNPTLPKTFTEGNFVTENGRNAFINVLGYRFATPAEVTKAREAATPGAVNNWTASVQVKPRNLPGSVNEYGFDVSTTSGYWVIKE